LLLYKTCGAFAIKESQKVELRIPNFVLLLKEWSGGLDQTVVQKPDGIYRNSPKDTGRPSMRG